MPCFIYGLKCPQSRKIRYVGKSVDPKKRYLQHTRYQLKGDTYKEKWIRKLISQGLKPELVIIEECSDKDWEERERYWISFYTAKGHPLTNGTNGGDGFGLILLDIEAARRDKIRAKRKGVAFSDKHKESLSKAAKLKFQNNVKLRENLRRAASSLSDESVLEIYRQACEGKKTFKAIGEEFGVSQPLVSEIFNGKKHHLITGATKKDDPRQLKREAKTQELVNLYKNGVTVSELSSLNGVTEDSVRRALKKGLGMPVAQYECQQRKLKAQQLKKSGLSFEEIGAILGMKPMSVWALLTREKKYERA